MGRQKAEGEVRMEWNGIEPHLLLSFCEAAVCLDFRQEGQQPEKQNRLKRCGVGKVLRKKIAKHHVPIWLAEQLHDVFRVLRTVNNRKIVCYAE